MNRIAKYRPALAAFLMMVSLATSSTAMSFMNQPVADDLGVGLGQFTLYYSLMIAVGAFTAPIVGQLTGRVGVRKLVAGAALWGGVCLCLFSFSNALWMFYAVGIAFGLLSATAVNLIANVVLQSYYSTTEAADLIGLVMAGSGVGSILYSAILPGVLHALGWRMAYRVIAAIWIALLLFSLLVLGRADPAVSRTSGPRCDSGMIRSEALKSPILYLLMAGTVILAFGSGLAQHFPMVLAEQGYSAGAAGAVISFYSAVLTVGKIAQGILYGRAGLKRGGAVTFALLIAGFVLLNTAAAYPAFACLGVGMGIATTFTPVLAKVLFGQKEYGSIFGIVAMAMSVGSFVSTPLWGLLYDMTGSYRLGFIVMPILFAVAFLLQMSALTMRENAGRFEEV